MKYNGEEYLPIDYPGIRKGVYFINDNGTSIISTLHHKVPRKITMSLDSDGYYKTMLQHEFCDKSMRVHVHRLVMYVHKILPPKNMLDPTVDHINGDKTNNSISNLRWLERRDNSYLNTTVGHNFKGEGNGDCKITEEIAKLIIQDLIENDSNPISIARKYNVSYNIMYSIKQKASWTHLTENINFKIRRRNGEIYRLHQYVIPTIKYFTLTGAEYDSSKFATPFGPKSNSEYVFSNTGATPFD